VSEATRTQEIQKIEGEIQSMEAELSDNLLGGLTWDEITSTTMEEATQKEARRGLLPRWIDAAKRKRLELVRQNYEAELEQAQQINSQAYDAFQKEEEKLRKAKEKRDKAWSEWQIRFGVVNGIQDRIRSTDRQLRELGG
jgi:hypothetical protein